jgi:sterol desaturase/sphingolipid hydroxylase (fatty acid hydroxylase superfamily)
MSDILDAIQLICVNLGRQALATFLAPGSHFSLLSLLAALCVATLVLALRRRPRALPVRVLVRALLPRGLFRHPSSRADVGMFLFNALVAGAMFGGLLVSASFIAQGTVHALGAAFGPQAPSVLPGALLAAVATLLLYLAYEFAYWLDHMLMHRFAFLWPFHAVHHGAERLTPLTNFRVHPVDTILFYNLVALITGAVRGALDYGYGPGHEWTVGGANLLVMVSVFLVLHLQHSELWIAFPGRWGKVFLSPAHHQVHHSADPRHFNRNFGASLALFDRLFGTLHVPGAKREVTRFGIGPVDYDPHGVTGTLVTPFAEAGTAALRSLRQVWRPKIKRTHAAAPAAPAHSASSDRTPATRPASAAPAV